MSIIVAGITYLMSISWDLLHNLTTSTCSMQHKVLPNIFKIGNSADSSADDADWTYVFDVPERLAMNIQMGLPQQYEYMMM